MWQRLWSGLMDLFFDSQLETRLLPVALNFSVLTGNDVVGRDEIARELVTLTFVSFASRLDSTKSTTISELESKALKFYALNLPWAYWEPFQEKRRERCEWKKS